MKRTILTLALLGSAGFAQAADMVLKAPPAATPAPAPAFDIAFGAVVMSDYNFRGVSQSNKGPSAGAYFEPQLTLPLGTVYLGVGGLAIDWPSAPNYGFTNPSAEIDLYGGVRNTWGQLTADVGFIYYYYPKELFNGFTDDSDFWEVYLKLTYAVTPELTIGGSVFYTPDLLNYSQTFTALGINADAAATYASITAKWVTPVKLGEIGTFISGELAHWWIDDKGFRLAGFTDPSYTFYNAGLAFTYKAFTLDLRWYGTDMNAADCGAFLLVGNPHPSNSWCKDTFIVALKVDSSLNGLK